MNMPATFYLNVKYGAEAREMLPCYVCGAAATESCTFVEMPGKWGQPMTGVHSQRLEDFYYAQPEAVL